MLQVLRRGLREIVVEEVPEPLVGPGEVKIRTAVSLISSGTEIAGLHSEGLTKEVIHKRDKIGSLVGRAVTEHGIIRAAQAILDKFREFSITGYSGSGIVIEKSKEVKDIDVNQRVAFGGLQTGHAEFVCAPRNLIVPVPEGVDLKEASLTTVGSIALHAVRNAQVTIGDSVAVIGLGLIGQLVLQLLQIAGVRVFGIDPRSDRRESALNHGAELVFEPHENPKMAVQTLTNGHGVDAVIICASSKTSEPLDLGVDLSRSRATIVVVGMIKMEMSWEAVYRKELKLVVSRAYGPGSYDPLYEKKGVDYPIDYVRWTENRNMAEFLRLMKDGKIQTKHIITHEFPLLEAPIAYQQLASGQKGVLGVVLRYPDFNLREKPKEMRISLNNVSPKSHSAKDQLRVGIIGLGNIARWVHLPNVSNHPKLILKGVCTPKGYKAKHFGIRFKSEYCTTDYKQIIEDPEIDLVMICTRHDLHASMATEALNAGKHVFLEKPMALTREECLRLVQLVKETGLGFMVNFNRRFSPIYQVAKETISGKGPKLMSIRMNSPDMTGSYWMMDPVEGGGAVLGEGCHFFDLMAWFTNSAPVSVFARNLSFHDDPLVSKNNIACTLSFEDGSVGNLVYETIGNRRLGSERLEISAGGVSVVVEDARRLQIWKGFFSKLKSRKKLKAEKGYYEILHEFVEGVLRGRSFEEEARAGAQATLCALAALKSLETGIPESIEAI